MMCTLGDRKDFWFSAVSIGLVENSRVISGSRSTSVMLSICGYLRISRTARPSPPPSTSTRRGAGMAG